MTLYVRKGDLFSAKIIEQEEKIETHIGEITVYPENVIMTDTYGRMHIVNKKWLDDQYVPVEKVKKPKVDIEEIAANYAQDWSNIENYDSFQKSVRKRNELNNN